MITCSRCDVHDIPDAAAGCPRCGLTFESKLLGRAGMSLVGPSRGAGILLVEGVG
jgi:hypothetical protein